MDFQGGIFNGIFLKVGLQGIPFDIGVEKYNLAELVITTDLQGDPKTGCDIVGIELTGLFPDESEVGSDTSVRV